MAEGLEQHEAGGLQISARHLTAVPLAHLPRFCCWPEGQGKFPAGGGPAGSLWCRDAEGALAAPQCPAQPLGAVGGAPAGGFARCLAEEHLSAAPCWRLQPCYLLGTNLPQ